MIQSNEERVVKFLETIANCMVKSNEMAEEALKKNRELYEANMAMVSQIKHEEPGIFTKFPDAIKLEELDGT